MHSDNNNKCNRIAHGRDKQSPTMGMPMDTNAAVPIIGTEFKSCQRNKRKLN